MHNHQNVKQETIEFPEHLLKEVGRQMAKFPDGKQKSAVLAVLHIAQAHFGYLSEPVMDYVARILHVLPIEVYEVATFYSMFDTQPIGKVKLEVCRTGPCMIEGSEKIVAYIELKLGIKVGQTTPDGIFSLKTVECLGACGYAPMLQAGNQYHEHLTEEKIDSLLAMYRENSESNYWGLKNHGS
ncbi:MAG: NAD(P)H-dependent oxidoreductase subunit E [Flavobacteriaceae bacterium]|nr:NAD(P)H-dependent oxidoreductase subunit E [Flavobacteriaceae bacterium]